MDDPDHGSTSGGSGRRRPMPARPGRSRSCRTASRAVDVPEWPDADERTAHNWLRAEALLEADYSMRALTSPIYFAHRGDPDTGGECACHPPAQRRQYSDLDL